MAHTTNTRGFQDQKKVAADKRNAKLKDLSLVQRLANLDARPGNCAKERKRLTQNLPKA